MMKAFMTTPQPQQLAQPLLSPALPEPSAYIEEVPASTNDALTTYGAPMTPGSHATYDTSSLPMFVEGSSSRPISVPPSPSLPSHLSPQSLPTPGTPGVSHRTASTAPTSSTVQSAQSWTTSGSSHIHPDAAARPPSRLTALPSPAQTPVVTAAQPPANRRKRRTPPPRVDSDEDSDVDSDFEFRSKRRRNGHDTRCLTIAVSFAILRSLNTADCIHVGRLRCVFIYTAVCNGITASRCPTLTSRAPSWVQVTLCASCGAGR